MKDPAEVQLVAFHTTAVSPEHPLNAPPPMVVTLFGILIVVNPLHRANAQREMTFRVSGSTTAVSPEQSEKAPSSMTSTPLGINAVILAPLSDLQIFLIASAISLGVPVMVMSFMGFPFSTLRRWAHHDMPRVRL